MKSAKVGSRRRVFLVLVLALAILAAAACHSDDPPHIGFLAGWSPDGKRVALAPYPGNREMAVESSLWILDVVSGRTSGLLEFPEGLYCLHPKWSAGSDRLVFGLVELRNGEPESDGGRVPLSIWMVGTDGGELRRIAEGAAGEDALFAPGLISWGPGPSSVIYPEYRDGRTMAVLLDLVSGSSKDLLPRPADIYEFQPAPRNGLAAVLLLDTDVDEAELLTGDLASGEWVTQDVFPLSVSGGWFPRPRLHWSPDGSRLIVSESDRDQACGGGLRLYDLSSRWFRRYCAGVPNTALFWNEDGSAVAFSGESMKEGASRNGIYVLDFISERIVSLFPEEENHLLSWNPEDNRIYYLRTATAVRHKSVSWAGAKNDVLSLFSCTPEGLDVRELSVSWLSFTWGWTVSPSGRHALLLDERDSVRLLPLGFLSPAWQFAIGSGLK